MGLSGKTVVIFEPQFPHLYDGGNSEIWIQSEGQMRYNVLQQPSVRCRVHKRKHSGLSATVICLWAIPVFFTSKNGNYTLHTGVLLTSKCYLLRYLVFLQCIFLWVQVAAVLGEVAGETWN